MKYSIKLTRSVKEIQRLNDQELENGVSITGSWHNDYNDTAYIFIGGLPFHLNEGDLITIFSQYGTPVHVKLARDKQSGKSKGFAWLKYEDQRSTVLAVDNFNGIDLLGRTIKVDHTYYKPQEGEVIQELEGQNNSHYSDLVSNPRSTHHDNSDDESARHRHRRHHTHHRHDQHDHHNHHHEVSNQDPDLVDPMRDYFRSKKKRKRDH